MPLKFGVFPIRDVGLKNSREFNKVPELRSGSKGRSTLPLEQLERWTFPSALMREA